MNKEELYKQHKKLIEKVASKHYGRIKGLPTYSTEDILQMANIGFIKACNTFEDGKGIPFKAYASKMMHWQINNGLRNKRAMVKFPYYFENVWKLATLHHTTYTKKDMKKLEKISKYTYEQIEQAMRWYHYNNPTYLDCEGEGGTDMYDKVAGTEMDDTHATVSEFLSTLTDKQRQVVELLMSGKNQAEIGRILKVSQQHVSRIVKSLQKAWLDNYE